MKAIQSLYDVSRKLSGTVSIEDVLWVVARQAAAIVEGQVVVLLREGEGPSGGELAIRAAFPPEDTLQPGEWAAARWAFDRGELAGWRTGTLPNALYQFQPLRTSSGNVGVIGIAPEARDRPLPAQAERAFAALIDQGNLAIERATLVVEARRSEALAERERLQTTLLSSISHDLRTPLASILGSVTSLRELGDRMAQRDRDDLMLTIEEETRRLTRFVANLLDITRVDAGALDVRRDWIEVSETVLAAVRRARKAFPARVIEIEAPPLGDQLVQGDAVMFEQAVFNLLDNADKYAGSGSPTLVRIAEQDGTLVLSVEDHGRGIPPGDLARVFEKFTRLGEGDGRPAGTGLGLAIAKGVIEAMGGTIHAESPVAAGQGTRIVIRLPLPTRAAAAAETSGTTEAE